MAEKKRKMQLSDAEKKRRSEMMKRLHAEGKAGGAQKGAGRPKKERAQEHVADRIKEDGEKIYKALLSALSSDSPTVKLKAALAMLDIETKEHETQMKEAEKKYEQMDRDKLLLLMRERFQQLKEQGVDIDGLIFGSARESGRKRVENLIDSNGRALPSGEVSKQD